MKSPYECDEGVTDPFATREFYELCQAYRHTPLHELELIVERFEALKDFGRRAVAEIAPELLASLKFAVKLLDGAFPNTAQVEAIHAAIAKAEGQ